MADRIDCAIENPDPRSALLGVATAYAEFAPRETSAFRAPYDGHDLVPTLQRVVGDLLDALE